MRPQTQSRQKGQWLPSIYHVVDRRGLPIDERWERKFSPIRFIALSLMAEIFCSNDWEVMLEMLQSRNLLQWAQCEYIRHQEEDAHQAAAFVLSIVEERPAPSFEKFCDFLGEVNGGMRLLAILLRADGTDVESRESESAPHAQPKKESKPESKPKSSSSSRRGKIKKEEADPRGRAKPTKAESKARSKAKQTATKSASKTPRFPRANSAPNSNVISAVCIVGASKWEDICSHLLSSNETAEIKEQHRSHMARLKACIEMWARKSKKNPTVRRLLDICEIFGVSERVVKEKYRSLPS